MQLSEGKKFDKNLKISSLKLQQIQNLLQKFYNREMIFSCGVFNINWQLGLSIVATVTTYVIIICQFEISS